MKYDIAMAQHWREPLDPSRHKDWVDTRWIGGLPRPLDRLVPAFSYFVRECGTTLEFASLDQLREALDWFQLPLQPSSRGPDINLSTTGSAGLSGYRRV